MTKEIGHGFIQNGPSDLSKNSKFTQLTENILPVKGFKYHSIIGNTDSTEHQLMNDGVVHYNSAHLDGAVSEKLLKADIPFSKHPKPYWSCDVFLDYIYKI